MKVKLFVMFVLLLFSVGNASANIIYINDTFTDSTGISSSENITVSGGEVKISETPIVAVSDPSFEGGDYGDHSSADWSYTESGIVANMNGQFWYLYETEGSKSYNLHAINTVGVGGSGYASVYQNVDLTDVTTLTYDLKIIGESGSPDITYNTSLGSDVLYSRGSGNFGTSTITLDVSDYVGVQTLKFELYATLFSAPSKYVNIYIDNILTYTRKSEPSYLMSTTTSNTSLLILNTTLTSTTSNELNTNISYNVSHDNGSTWYSIVNGSTVNFSGDGRDFIYMANFTTDVGSNTSILNDVSFLTYVNNVPTIPSIVSPTNTSIIKSHDVFLNVSSNDADNDTLTYYFYGDVTNRTTLINISTTGNYTWNIEDYDIYHWKVQAYDGYEYSANTSLQQFTLLAPPDLQTPTNASTHTYPFPPLLHDLTFTWQDTNAPAYKFQIARDEDFNIIAESGTTTGNVTIKSLTADNYWWRVYAYETDTGTYSNVSNTWIFTINETVVSDGTAIDGVVYEITTAGSVAVEGALVNIWNSSWSGSMLVGQNGYYYFDGLHNSTYSLRATKTGYTDSAIELVTAVYDETTTRNILLQSTSGAGQQYVDHYVKFTVKSLFGALYGGVDVNVYLVDAVIPQYTATTGNDGSVAFELNENQQYRLTFISASQGINEERTLYPVENAYNVYVIANIFATGGNIISDDISISIETATAGANAYINVTYTDNKTETTALYFYLNQTNIHDSQNQTLIASSGEIHATGFYSFTVTDYTGEAYLIHVHATHDTYGDIKESYSVRFEGLLDSFGWDGIWVLIALGCITFTAFMFGAKNATQGSFVICVEAWFFIAMGMFGDYNTIWFKAGVVMATVVSFLANMEKHDSERP